ncbi:MULTISPECIES: hypothetical protein [Burkholderia]|jgi:hypothetical protein|uniref:Uncharacterized protein n=3 Tax=Burkholderia contaminans TaxID=488447 RepID=A0A1R1VZ57_9BURK|nr:MULTISPECIES: hypothetical protein [Burkholderia]UTP27492.1 hypothetical protein NMB33_35535 [Burkholderia sp. FXe9]KKL42135.1 hypothetical protein WR31_09070 [Burkholderia contaminans LMG 23361]MBA9829139.1 hypothetical protein [Burkholderia contaminans]MBA9837964.1 hypothetical protein [Burkholderia contaminans]MBA9862557.1 hypothetical protein [Burkholderia contaminans]
MSELKTLIKRYGGAVDHIRGATYVHMPMKLPSGIDVGFATTYSAEWLGRLFPFLRHFEMPQGLYIYGDRAEILSRVIGHDHELCSALRFVLDQYAFDLECTDMRLVASLNTISRPLSLDPSGGWHLVSKLAMIAGRLGELDYHEFDTTPRSIFAWGPGRFRNLSIRAIFVVVFCIPLYLMIHFSHPITVLK